ncbi:MAG TPA: hypothetical protein VEW28_02570 [Candidatus Kapabacteria bacterium]|nr:hypothetical protein [Candidatus Kapabacteria bacterium]
MKKLLRYLFVIVLVAVAGTSDTAFAQGPAVPSAQDTSMNSVTKRRQDMGIVKSLAVMPYATLSYNLQSGQAFPKSAQGVGYGFGIAFDFAPDRQPVGFYLDFAYQDMRASSADGACKLINPTDTIAQTVPVTHFFSYALVEAFLKLQSPKTNGYFLIGFSTGISTTGLSDKQGPGVDEFSDWSTTTYYTKFRFDLRGGLGFKLFKLGDHDAIFEARFGYPLTTILTDYQDICNGSAAKGSWRDVSLQANFGIRL